MKSLTKNKEKKQAFPIYPIENWSVEKYGVKLSVNLTEIEFDSKYNKNEIVSLDVEDNEEGVFVGLGLYDGKTCFYWSVLPLWLNKYL